MSRGTFLACSGLFNAQSQIMFEFNREREVAPLLPLLQGIDIPLNIKLFESSQVHLHA